ncbi:diguanylate cyclase domain-containing protein [Herbaspirillum sp. RV1423]|uniref:diguanylate cyclase domain-containing protein n=1 Tax=Herbaspirillum sp. RV1423 TaxID=1443993 RepID=UPI0004BB0883|nr:diguanylate cyclase [Herbaspirillum sp. RV1423]
MLSTKKLSSTLSLSSWVTIGVVLSVLITTVSVLLLVDQFTRNYARNEAEARLGQLAWQMQDALDRSMAERYIDIKILAQRPSVREARDPARMRIIFNELQKTVPNYAWIGFATPDGNVLAAANGLLEGQSVAERPWYKKAQKDFFVGDYHPAVLLEKKLPAAVDPWRFVDIAMPINDQDGRFKGVLGIHLSWAWARDLARKLLNPANDRYDVEIMIVREDGTVLLGPKGLEEKKIATDSFRASLRQPSGAMRELGDDGRQYLTGFARTGLSGEYGEMKWTVLVRQPEQIAMAGFKELERQVLFVGCLVGLLLTALVFFLTRRLVAPMNALSAALERRATGDDKAVVPIVGTYYEIQLLSTTLSSMVQREENYLREVRSLNEGLEQRVNDRTRRLHETAIALQQALDSQRENQMQLEESENELRAILQNAHDAFIAIDEDGIVLEWNRQAEQLLGWAGKDAIGKELAELIIPLEQRELHRRGMKHFIATGEGVVINNRIEINALRRDGSELPVEMTVGCIERRAGHLFIAFLHDITERQAFRNSLQEMALTDILTGLPNRRAFTQKLPEAMARAAREQQPMGLLFMDIDGFKGVNDKYGHEAGDELLVQFAARLTGSVREVDLAARLAGDEFTVILERLQQGQADALIVAEKILAAMRGPFVLSAATVNLSSSIGVAIYEPGRHTDQDALVAQADKAMYAAKKAGKNRVEWNTEENPA